MYFTCKFDVSILSIHLIATFKIVLLSEPQTDLIAEASGVLAILADSSTEARNTTALHTKVIVWTVAWQGQDSRFPKVN